MSGSRPTLADLNTRTQADLASRVNGATPSLLRSILRALATAFSGALNGLYGYLDNIKAECNPYTAILTLPMWASLWLGANPQKQPAYASGAAGITGSTVDAPIPDGTALQDGLGAEYLTVGDVDVAGDGTATLQLLAIDTGSSYNQAPGVSLTFVSPLLGVATSATVGAAGIGGGADLESIDSLRARMLARIQNPPHGGNQADYVEWATSVPNITRAWCKPTPSGPGTVLVYVANDNYVGAKMAADADVAAANTYLQSVKPLGVVISDGMGGALTGLTVEAATLQPVDFMLTESPDNSATRAAVEAGLATLFRNEAVPEGTIPLNHFRGTIYNAAGLYDFNMTAPTTDQVAGAGYVLSLGTITWS